MQTKKEQAPASAIFHFIGHLQSNKAKIAAATCDMIETVDRLKLGTALNNHLQVLNKTMDVLIQVNIGNDVKKAGVKSSETEELLIQLNELPRIRVCGLMTMPPFVDNPELSRPYFHKLRLVVRKTYPGKGCFQRLKNRNFRWGCQVIFTSPSKRVQQL